MNYIKRLKAELAVQVRFKGDAVFKLQSVELQNDALKKKLMLIVQANPSVTLISKRDAELTDFSKLMLVEGMEGPHYFRLRVVENRVGPCPTCGWESGHHYGAPCNPAVAEKRLDVCRSCGGTGWVNADCFPHEGSKCDPCNGTGKVERV